MIVTVIPLETMSKKNSNVSEISVSILDSKGVRVRPPYDGFEIRNAIEVIFNSVKIQLNNCYHLMITIAQDEDDGFFAINENTEFGCVVGVVGIDESRLSHMTRVEKHRLVAETVFRVLDDQYDSTDNQPRIEELKKLVDSFNDTGGVCVRVFEKETKKYSVSVDLNFHLEGDKTRTWWNVNYAENGKNQITRQVDLQSHLHSDFLLGSVVRKGDELVISP